MRVHLTLIAITIALTPSIAVAGPHVTLTNEAAFIEAQNDRVVLVPSTKNAPVGAHVRYTIVAHNEGDRPAINLVPRALVPASEEFTHASPDANAEYSLDGGKTWSHAPTVRVKTATGETMRPARPAEYTAVRWTSLAPLAPGARAKFSYDIIVR